MTEEEKLPEGESHQPPYVPLPAYYLQGERDDQINLAEYILVLWRRRFLILLGTLVCALTAFILTVMGPPIYQTKATLILQPPPFSTELKSAPLSAEALKTMLESDSIASQLRRQLAEKQLIPQDVPIEQIKDMLSVQIPVENEPLIDLVVEADSPEKAEIVANTWAEIFVAENASLTQSGQQATFDLIESQYPVVKNTLMDRQAELKEAQEDYEQVLLRLERSWSLSIVDFNKETERLHKEQQKETERLRLEFTNRWKPELLKAELKIKEAKLLNRLTTAQLEYDTLVPASDHLREELESIRKAIDELQSLITQKEIELFSLLKDRELELNNLLADRQVRLANLQKTDESEMTRLRRESDFQVNELTREVDAARRGYESVAEKYRNVELAKVQEEPDVKIGALAVAPGRPAARRTSLNTLIALVVGFTLSVLLAFLLEYVQSISVTASSKREIEVPSSRSPGFGLDPPDGNSP